MDLVIVTLVNDDLANLQRTEKSILSQSLNVNWKIVTPVGENPILEYLQNLEESGIVNEIIFDNGGGIYSAMNYAIEKSTPEDWIWFLNAGDTLADSKCYEIIKLKVKNSSSRWIYGGHFLGSAEGEILGEKHAPKSFQIKHQLFARNYISHQATIFETSFLLELGGFSKEYQLASDWDLIVRAAKIEGGERVSKSISVFYLGGASTKLRKISNVELLALRKKHLPRRFGLRSYMWFAARLLRNKIVQSVEGFVPDLANDIRKIRLHKK
jgi:hypothetical protein